MLRRKLLLILAPLVALLVLSSAAAIWLLQGVLQQLNGINRQAWVIVEDVNRLGNMVSIIELDLYQLQTRQKRHLDQLIDAHEQLRQLVASVGRHDVVHASESWPVYERLQARLPVFERHIGALATTQDVDLAAHHNQEALGLAIALRQDILQLSHNAAMHAQQEQAKLSARFRWLVLGLAILFVLVINISVVVLLRMAAMILRPVDRLVEATGHLAQERFDYRVQLDQQDEFGQLARAYNHLAEQLQANEKRRIEVLGQVALALNHELNNAMATIGLQLQIFARQAGRNEATEQRLRQIRESLERMARTVQSLKNVRRIVLTDYISGVKMLDLERSMQEEQSTEPAPAPSPAPPAAEAP